MHYPSRLCAYLPCSLAANTSRFAHRCGACDDVCYCSEGCKSKAALDGEGQECGILREGCYVDDADRPRCQFYPTLESGLLLSCQMFNDITDLRPHLEEWTTDDLERYTRHEVFIMALFALGPSCLLPEKWYIQDILGVVSRIESNIFGMWLGDRAPIDILVEWKVRT